MEITAYDTCYLLQGLKITRFGQEGFEMAMTRSKKLCCVDKANVLESSRL